MIEDLRTLALLDTPIGFVNIHRFIGFTPFSFLTSDFAMALSACR